MNSSSSPGKAKYGAAVVPIMAIYALGASQGGVNAGLATISQAFPDAGANISYITSMVALGMIPACILSGMLAGRKVGYKSSIIVSLVLYLVAGMAPALLPEGTPFAVLLATRFVFGLAVGWSFPLGQALVLKLFDSEKKRASIMGVGMAFFNVGQIIMALAAGYLALISWQACFFVYLIGAVSLLLVATLLKEPEKDSPAQNATAHDDEAPKGSASKANIPLPAWALMVMLALCNAFAMPALSYSSFVIDDPSISGIVLSLFTVIGALSSLMTGLVYGKLGKWSVPLAAIELAACFVVCGLCANAGASGMVAFIVALLLGSWGYTIIIPAITNTVASLVPPAASTRAMGFNTAFQQFGGFLSTPIAALIMGILGSASVAELILPCSVCLAACAVLLIVITAFTRQKAANQQLGK